MNNKFIFWGVGFIAVLALFVSLSRPGTITERVVESLGGASSPAVVDGCMEVNGVTTCSYQQSMRNASTTCAFKAPIDRKSVLIHSSVSVTDIFGGSYYVEFGKDTKIDATTTSLTVSGVISAAATVIASTSPAASTNPGIVFAAGSFLNIKLASSSPTVTGTCTAVFQKL